ncbi:MAG: transposase [Salinisphaera sp.]|jgi:hypothetical protein|nr:transposase [Salinisphaera sp.]
MSPFNTSLRLADLFEAGRDALLAQYGSRLQPHQWQAMTAIEQCRTEQRGQVHRQCPGCGLAGSMPQSCGHRSCPTCQNHTTTQWLDRQQAKRLPVDYFMVTFTLPAGLRPLAAAQPKTVYSALFAAASSTLKGFGKRKLGAELGQCAVLHTHNRRLDLHPHVHIVVPGGGIDTRRRQFKKLKGRYLFNAFALARVFRARLLAALHRAGVSIPVGLPAKWVVDCRNVGRGEPALQYLSRYLYRGVIRERDLIGYDTDAGTVTFRYQNAQTGRPASRTLPMADFLWRVLIHVLPTGFRRVRDYGFLHGNARRRLALVQLVLRVLIQNTPPRARPPVCCPACHTPMVIVRFTGRPHPDT